MSASGGSFRSLLAMVGDVAHAHRLAPESLALGRCRDRVLAADIRASGEHPPSNGRDGGDQAQGRAGSGPETRVTGEQLAPGMRLTAGRLALVASTGVASLAVSRKPTVAVFTVGDDLVPPGLALAPGQSYDASRELLMGLLRDDGLEPTAWPPLGEDTRQIEVAVRDAACAFDVVLLCQADSAGSEAPLVDVLSRFGELVFTQDLAETGRSVVFGNLDQARVLGLPRDPALLLSTWQVLGRALVDGLQGGADARPAIRARLATPIPAGCGPRAVPVTLQHDADGILRALPLDVSGLSLSAIAEVDGVLVLPNERLEEGSAVDVLPL